MTAGGLTFTWPNEPSAQPDNTMAEGQTIALSGSGGSLGFLAAANNSAESGPARSTTPTAARRRSRSSVGNFWYPSGQDGNPVEYPGGRRWTTPTTRRAPPGHEVYVFEQSVSLESGKTVAAVTLPSLGDVAGYNPALHIFAIAVG